MSFVDSEMLSRWAALDLSTSSATLQLCLQLQTCLFPSSTVRLMTVLLMTLVAVATLSLEVHAQNLLNRCAGTIQEATVPYTPTGTSATELWRVVGNAAGMVVDCIAVDVLPAAGSACDRRSQPSGAVVPYTINVVAATANSQYRWPISSALGVSTEMLRFHVPEPAIWAVEMRNHDDQNCTLAVRTIMEASTFVPTPSSATSSTSLSALRPEVLYAGKRTALGFSTIAATGATLSDRVRFRQKYQGNSTWLYAERSLCSALTSGLGLSSAVMTSTWEYTFEAPGTYEVHYSVGGALAAFHEIGQISVYGDDPSSFRFGTGTGPQGQIYLNTPTQLLFSGLTLDTRPSVGDQAKFVPWTSACVDSTPPAGGAAVGTDLMTIERIGWNITDSAWLFSISAGGHFRVCYRHNGIWAEVPDESFLPFSRDAPTCALPAASPAVVADVDEDRKTIIAVVVGCAVGTVVVVGIIVSVACYCGHKHEAALKRERSLRMKESRENSGPRPGRHGSIPYPHAEGQDEATTTLPPWASPPKDQQDPASAYM